MGLAAALLGVVGALAAAALPGGEAVSAEALRRHTFFLGDDALQGRAPGTPGARKAAGYIAGELEALGLRPLGRNGTWLQDVPLHGTVPVEASELVITSECGSGRLRLAEDYLLFTGGVQTPPLERTPRNRRLWGHAQVAADALGIELEETLVGGGSDGNTTSLFTATLDGLGPVGDGAHAAHEHLVVDAWVDRCALLALLLMAPVDA